MIDKRKITLLLYIIGQDVVDLFNTFTLAAADKDKIDKVIQAFKNYCNPKKNVTYERFVFFSRNQKVDETIDHYVTELQKLAKLCDF